jgi:predicted nucleic acid-binding protein
MSIFIDTSALLAVINADDSYHEQAKNVWTDIVINGVSLISHNYILVETFALAQHRLGIEAVSVLQNDVVPLLRIEWVREPDHLSGITALIAANRRKLSLVDCISFIIMRKLGINKAFALDKHFKEQGFNCIP